MFLLGQQLVRTHLKEIRFPLARWYDANSSLRRFNELNGSRVAVRAPDPIDELQTTCVQDGNHWSSRVGARRSSTGADGAGMGIVNARC